MFESTKSQSHHHFNEDICEYLMKKKIYQISYFVNVMVIQSSVLTMILGLDSPLCTPIMKVHAFIKDVKYFIQKCITWPKKSSNLGKQAQDKACIDFGLRPKKLNTIVKTK